MAADLLVILLRVNVAASLAVVLALLLRASARRHFGAHRAYAIWLAVPVAAAGALMPSPSSSGPVGPLEMASRQAETWLAGRGHEGALLVIWLTGVVASLGLCAWRQSRFLAAAREGRAGPATVGVIQPRLVTPGDFAQRFTPEQWRLVRAHERAHMDRLDARCNALVVVVQCLNWFNPLAHVAARAMRFDQELACDATVMERLPTERRRYAEALLRTQQCALDLPLGCQWVGQGPHPLVTRLSLLVEPPPSQRRRDLGLAIVALIWTLAFAAAWAAQPPDRKHESPVRPNILFIDLVPPAPVGSGSTGA